MARWNTEVKRTGGETNVAPKPSETQFRIAAFIGRMNTKGLAGIDNCDQWCRSLLSIGGNNLQFTPILPYFQHWGGMNLDHEFVQVWKFSEDQKKNANRTLFLPEFR